jgi:hypothetical protein
VRCWETVGSAPGHGPGHGRGGCGGGRAGSERIKMGVEPLWNHRETIKEVQDGHLVQCTGGSPFSRGRRQLYLQQPGAVAGAPAGAQTGVGDHPPVARHRRRCQGGAGSAAWKSRHSAWVAWASSMATDPRLTRRKGFPRSVSRRYTVRRGAARDRPTVQGPRSTPFPARPGCRKCRVSAVPVRGRPVGAPSALSDQPSRPTRSHTR